MMFAGAAAFAATVGYVTAPAYAQHSFAATYFEDKTESVTITRPSDGWKWGGTFD